MLRRRCIYLLLVSFLALLVFSFAFAENGTPDPKEVTLEEVDPDGLEGLHAPRDYNEEQEIDGGKNGPQGASGSWIVLRSLCLVARVLGF